MKQITETQLLQWKAELNIHRDKLAQAEQLVLQETKLISMIEGGIQFGEALLNKNESANQALHTTETSPKSIKEPSKK